MARGVPIVKVTVDGVEVDAKACTKCCEVKPLTEFYHCARSRGGRKSKCAICLRSESRQWRKENPDKHAELQREQYRRNPEYQKEYNKEYRERYPEKRKVYDANRLAIKMELPNMCTKACRCCGIAKPLTSFYLDRGRKDGHDTKCKECSKLASKSWLVRNQEKRRAYESSRLIKVLEARRSKRKTDNNYALKCRKYRSSWRTQNKDRDNASTNARRANRHELPQSLVLLPDKVCAITGKVEDTTLEHWIPFKTGHGGNVPGNVYLMFGPLNYSKQAKNPFDWFKANRQRFELNQSRFDSLVAKLAEQNGLTSGEFRDYTDWCFANPRNEAQIKRDNARYGYRVTSVELWRETRGNSIPNKEGAA